MEDFDALLNGDLSDFGTLALLADNYEDQGDLNGAEAIRWAAASGKRPYVPEGESTGSWFNGDKIKEAQLGDDYSDLPEVLYASLSVGEGEGDGKETANHKTYPSAKVAFLAFVGAFVAARKEDKEIPQPEKSYRQVADEAAEKRSEEWKAGRGNK